MALLGTGFRRILTLAIIAICIVLIALNIILNIKLRAEIPGLIEKFSKASGYEIDVKKVSLDFLFRLQLDGVSILDPKASIKDVLLAEQITVKPLILSSLLSQKINLGEIILHKPIVQSNRENVDNLLDFINSQREKSKGKPSQFELGLIKVLNAQFHMNPELIVLSPNFLVEIYGENINKEQEIKIEGLIGYLEKELAVNGSVLISPQGTKGDLELQVDKIDASSVSFLVDDSNELKALSKLSFEISDLISAKGDLKFDSKRGIFSENSLTVINFDLSYDKTEDTANIKTLDFKIDQVLKGSISGDITKVSGDTIFNLTGSADTFDIRDLLVKMHSDSRDLLSGEFTLNDLKVIGSRAKDNIQLSGGVIVDGFVLNSIDEGSPSLNNMDCKLKFTQDLTASKSFSLSSNGNCSAEKFFWNKTGEVLQINAHVNLDSIDKWSDNKIKLFNLNGKYLDGVARGSLNFMLDQGFGGGITEISGDIVGQELNLKKTPKTIIPANIEGNGQSVSAKFSGGSGNYKADISLIVNDFVLKSSKGREFKMSRVQSGDLVDFKYNSEKGENEEANELIKEKITINAKGLKYQELSFEEYRINSGQVQELSFLLDLIANSWQIDMSSAGSDFSIIGHDVTLKHFKESLSIKNSGREGFSGNVQGIEGKYKSVDFPKISWDYNFINDRVIVSDVNAQISSIGEFKTDNLFIDIGNQVGGYPYKVDFTGATFAGFEDKLNSEGIKGNFVINKPGTADLDWHGTVDVKKTSIVSQIIHNISNKITPSQGGINLEDITGKFLGGDLTGKIHIDTTTSPSGVDTDLKLLNASINSDSSNIKLPETILNFKGTLPNESLPEGQGNLEFKNLKINKQGVTSLLQANIKTRTVAETLYIDQGFIRGKSNQEISFTGEMNNSLNENRRLQLNIREFPISESLAVLSPFVPEDFRNGKTQGNAVAELVFYNFLYPDSRWGGKMSISNASFLGDYAGAPLSIKSVNGTITIKDKASSENPLASVMGEHLKLSKSIFQKYLKTFKEKNLKREGLDFLNIEEFEYGILKFTDVECALEVDTEKINLRRIISRFFRGDMYGVGLLKFNADQTRYNLAFLFEEISLQGISERISPTQEYISGRLNGLFWITGEGAELDTIDGPFKFWSKKSSKEPRRIGQALLARMGARERLVLGSSRAYDNGNISGYINDGLITFKEFDISNSILGIRNLTIQADSVQNSITISHLISVVRELARRSEAGLPVIETN